MESKFNSTRFSPISRRPDDFLDQPLRNQFAQLFQQNPWMFFDYVYTNVALQQTFAQFAELQAMMNLLRQPQMMTSPIDTGGLFPPGGLLPSPGLEPAPTMPAEPPLVSPLETDGGLNLLQPARNRLVLGGEALGVAGGRSDGAVGVTGGPSNVSVSIDGRTYGVQPRAGESSASILERLGQTLERDGFPVSVRSFGSSSTLSIDGPRVGRSVSPGERLQTAAEEIRSGNIGAGLTNIADVLDLLGSPGASAIAEGLRTSGRGRDLESAVSRGDIGAVFDEIARTLDGTGEAGAQIADGLRTARDAARSGDSGAAIDALAEALSPLGIDLSGAQTGARLNDSEVGSPLEPLSDIADLVPDEAIADGVRIAGDALAEGDVAGALEAVSGLLRNGGDATGAQLADTLDTIREAVGAGEAAVSNDPEQILGTLAQLLDSSGIEGAGDVAQGLELARQALAAGDAEGAVATVADAIEGMGEGGAALAEGLRGAADAGDILEALQEGDFGAVLDGVVSVLEDSGETGQQIAGGLRDVRAAIDNGDAPGAIGAAADTIRQVGGETGAEIADGLDLVGDAVQAGQQLANGDIGAGLGAAAEVVGQLDPALGELAGDIADVATEIENGNVAGALNEAADVLNGVGAGPLADAVQTAAQGAGLVEAIEDGDIAGALNAGADVLANAGVPTEITAGLGAAGAALAEDDLSGALGAAAGALAGTSELGDVVAGGLQTVQAGVGVADAIENGDIGGAIQGVADIVGASGSTGAQLAGGIADVATAIENGDVEGAIGAAVEALDAVTTTGLSDAIADGISGATDAILEGDVAGVVDIVGDTVGNVAGAVGEAAGAVVEEVGNAIGNAASAVGGFFGF